MSIDKPAHTLAVACSSERVGTTMTLSPWFQLTGVATEWLAVSCSESMTRRICTVTHISIVL